MMYQVKKPENPSFYETADKSAVRRERGEEKKTRSELRKFIDDNVESRKAGGEKLIDQDPKRPALDEKTSWN